MVVDEDESVGATGDHRAQDFPGVGGGFVDAADGDDGGAQMAQSGIDRGDDHLFVGKVLDLWSKALMNPLRAVERAVVELFPGDSAAEFKGSGEL